MLISQRALKTALFISKRAAISRKFFSFYLLVCKLDGIKCFSTSTKGDLRSIVNCNEYIHV